MTGQRRVIARVLSEAVDHPDVEELYRRASALDARISVATVYRTVRLLEEKGILERRDFGGGRARYEASEHGHHHHLIDVDSGRVFEFEDAGHEQVIKAIAARLGFDLVSHRLELFGKRREPAIERRPRKAGPREAGPREAGPREAGLNEAGARDAGTRGAGTREAGTRKAAQEAVAQTVDAVTSPGRRASSGRLAG